MKDKILLILLNRLLKEKDEIIDALYRQHTWEKMKFEDWKRNHLHPHRGKTLEETFEEERKEQIDYSYKLYLEHLHKSRILGEVTLLIDKL